MKPRRNSLRLKGFDYSQPGAYFVTILTKHHRPHFGNVVDGRMRLSEMGKLVEGCWNRIPTEFRNTRIGKIQLMPDHLHGIVEITNIGLTNQDSNNCMGLINPTHAETLDAAPVQHPWMLMAWSGTPLGKIIRSFKARTSRLIRQRIYGSFGWHRGYYDRIIRDDIERYFVEEYIELNPLIWELRRGLSTMSVDDLRSRLQTEYGFVGPTLERLIERERDYTSLVEDKKTDY